VYLGAVVVLVTAMIGGLTATRVARLRQWLGVNVETFVASAFWRGARGRFMPPVMTETLPASLLERFAGDERTRLLHLLAFLTPLTTRATTGAQAP